MATVAERVLDLSRIRVCHEFDLPPDSMARLEVDSIRICLARTKEGRFYAIDDTCTHEEYSLSEGELWGIEVECPQHGSRFNLATGAVTGLPAVVPARVYRVIVENGDILVDSDGDVRE